MFDRSGKKPIPQNWPNAHITGMELLEANHPMDLDITEADAPLNVNPNAENYEGQANNRAAVIPTTGEELATPPMLAGLKKKIGNAVNLLWEETGPGAYHVRPDV